jgi:TPR repeat protein
MPASPPTASPSAAAPLEPAAPALRALERALDRDEIANLLKRGQELATQGDLAGARLLLRRAAEAGDAQAMQALGATYDSTVLTKLNVIGVAPDNARARAWYERAAAAGAPEAGRRLEQLAGRSQ